MSWLSLLADQAPEVPQQPGPPGLMQFLPMIFIVVVLYVLMIAPMRRQKKEQMNMLSLLKKNDKVITSAGILGTVVSIKEAEDEVTLRVDDTSNTRIRVLKSSIVRVAPAEDGKEKEVEAKTN